jgi:uncharacterized membrane protein YhaH (DUF805 family)
MWPSFVVLGVLDGIVGHRLPAAGDAQSVIGGIIVALVLNLVAVVALAWPVAALLRRFWRDMPWTVARNYGGTLCMLLVTSGFVVLGVVHHETVTADRNALRDAVTRAAAYIGARAPAPFRAQASRADTFTIQAGVIYRVCVADRAGTRHYCVVVNEHQPFDRSVRRAGSEPNAVLALGTN